MTKTIIITLAIILLATIVLIMLSVIFVHYLQKNFPEKLTTTQVSGDISPRPEELKELDRYKELYKQPISGDVSAWKNLMSVQDQSIPRWIPDNHLYRRGDLVRVPSGVDVDGTVRYTVYECLLPHYSSDGYMLDNDLSPKASPDLWQEVNLNFPRLFGAGTTNPGGSK